MHCGTCGRNMDDAMFLPQTNVCLKCQEDRYETVEKNNGAHLAIFITCAAYNIPFIPSMAPIDLADGKESKWEKYIDALKSTDKLFKGNSDKPRGFADGICDIRRVFGREMTEKDYARCIAVEQQKAQTIQGTEVQRERWGTGELCKNLSLTTEVYNMLDTQYELWMERYKGINAPQLESNIVTICKRNAVADHLVKIGEYGDAAKIQKMVDDLMASEQMRKKDEQPVEQLQIDAMVSALEKKGMMLNGALLSWDELVNAMRDNFIKSPKYKYTLDVADQMIMDYYNTFRANSDKEMLAVLPTQMKPEDEYGEFSKIETENEKKRKRYAGLTPVKYED